jgi:hypothetical protein
MSHHQPASQPASDVARIDSGTLTESTPRNATGRALWLGYGVECFVIVAAALVFWWFEALSGFNPTDDGFVLAQSWRILQGEVPHVDFTSPRPVLSALLHAPVLLLPSSQLAISRLVVTGQLAWIAFCGVALVESTTGRRLAWRPIWVVLAFLLNVGVWPVMAWHTIDGLFLGMTSFWLADRAIRRDWNLWVWFAIWALAGAAPLTKQGFIMVPILIAIACSTAGRWRTLRATPLALVPGLAYAIWVRNAPGGLSAALYSGSMGELLQPFKSAIGLVATPPGIAITACLFLGAGAMMFNLRRACPSAAVATAATLLGFGPLLLAGWMYRFNFGQPWSYLPVAGVIIASLSVGKLTIQSAGWTFAVLGLSFASSLSWGTIGPSLMAGTLLVWAVAVMLSDPRLPDHVGRVVVVALLVAALVLVIPARHANVYGEGPASRLDSGVEIPSLQLIRMSPQTAAYLEIVQTCVNRYPASIVAVLPDGAAIYPLLRLHNPMPSDWRIAAEIAPNDSQFLSRTLSTLRGSDSWLMLMQTYSLGSLSSRDITLIDVPDKLPVTLPEDRAFIEHLDGVPITCGSLIGKYHAPPVR